MGESVTSDRRGDKEVPVDIRLAIVVENARSVPSPHEWKGGSLYLHFLDEYSKSLINLFCLELKA